MGRASRKRAEQRASAAGSDPIRDARTAPPPRRPPFRRVPVGASSGIHRLEQMRWARVELDRAIACEVTALLAVGTDWGTIGRALGVSRQAARQRYGAPH
jgi:hypothetical protein